ncbi:MAG: NAD(P)H-dependent oxidoreductase [Treponema sp.]|nr:NAD(P)H-dependent oxidoreductase [Treponema sp.]
MTLYINACVRKNSRTNELARFVLAKHADADIQEVNLQDEQILPLDEKTLRFRDDCISCGDFSDPIFSYARQFAQADEIVIAAPYWDLLFPASLRAYIERVCVVGVTFAYTETGVPKSLCKAKRLTYVTTAGGFIGERHLGFDYIQAVATQFFGIRDVSMVKAEGLDIAGADVNAILERARNLEK